MWLRLIRATAGRSDLSILPEDPEAEQQAALYEQFRLLRFTESEAHRLAEVWADPLIVSWEMAKHDMGHYWAARIYGAEK